MFKRNFMLGGIILSAGESRRMGSPKALLKIKKSNFINHIIDVLYKSHVDEIVTVLGHDPEKIANEIDQGKSTVIINRNYREGQLSSLIAGLKYFHKSDVEGVIVCLVDHPLISVETISKMIELFQTSGGKIIVPIYMGKRGHPVLYAHSIFSELKKASPEIGAREIIWKHAEDVLEYETGDHKILIGVNTPEEYKKYEKYFL